MGRPGRARRRATSSRRSRRRWPRSARPARRPGRGSGSGRRRCAERWPQWSRTGSAGSPSSAGPGTSPRCGAPPSAADAAALRGLAKGKVAMTWVPWSSRRLAAASGYGAGVRAPGWYDHLFRHGGPQVIARWFCEVARVLRAGGYAGVAGAGDRRHPPGRDAGDAAPPPPGRPGRGDRRRGRGARRRRRGAHGAGPGGPRGRHGGGLGAGRHADGAAGPGPRVHPAPPAPEAGGPDAWSSTCAGRRSWPGRTCSTG